jgi:hypothetical protein
MKKIIALLLALTSMAAWGAANDMKLMQRKSLDEGDIVRFVPFQGADCFLRLNATSILPDCVQFSWISTFDGTYGSLTGVPSTFAPSAHNQAFSTITSTPTTLSGYGITDAYPLSGNPSGFVNQAGARGAISLTTTGTSGAATYNSGTGVLNVPNYEPGTGTVTSITAGTGLSGGVITTSGTISMPSIGTPGTYSGVTTDSQGRVTAGTTRSFNYPTRALDTCYQLSASRDVQVSYNVTINTTSTLAGGGVGTVYLESFTNSGCTTGTQEIGRFVNGNTQTLGLTVTMVQNVTGNLNGIAPAGVWLKQRTQINTGTSANVTFTALPGQETTL